jgi:ABC-type transporter Mla MlaB component
VSSVIVGTEGSRESGVSQGPGEEAAVEIVTDGSTLVLSGDFDVRSTWEVRAAIYDHLEEHDEDVVIDLTDVYAVDVTALKVLAGVGNPTPTRVTKQ